GLAPLGSGVERVPEFDRYPLSLLVRSPRRSEMEGVLPRCSLLGHVTGPRRLQDHLRSAALLTHAQWVPGCETTSYPIRVPTVKMPASWNTGLQVKRAAGDTPW
ncbi:unnamed protein product, partial [Staurois parvus]